MRGVPLRPAYCGVPPSRDPRRQRPGIVAGNLRRLAEPHAIGIDIRGIRPNDGHTCSSGRGPRRTAGRRDADAPPKSRTGGKPGHIARHRDGLRPFPADGRVGTDGSDVGNPAQPATPTGRSALSTGRGEGAAARDRNRHRTGQPSPTGSDATSGPKAHSQPSQPAIPMIASATCARGTSPARQAEPTHRVQNTCNNRPDPPTTPLPP